MKKNMGTTDATTLAQIKTFLNEHFEAGLMANCPACGQTVFKYMRDISVARAISLFLLYSYEMSRKASDDPWVYVPPFFAKFKSMINIGGEYAKLRYWKLIERKPGIRSDGSDRNGHWRITELGCRFVRRETKVPRYIYLYNRHLFGFSPELTDIEACLQNKFNYNELIGLKV